MNVPSILTIELITLYFLYPAMVILGGADVENRWVVWSLIGVYVVVILLIVKPRKEALGVARVHPILSFSLAGGSLIALAAVLLPLLSAKTNQQPDVIRYAALLLVYPFLSIPMQEFFFRSFFFFRYGEQFGSKSLVAVNSVLFGLNHAIYSSWVAVVGGLLAGLILSGLYVRQRSFWLCCLLHYLLGLVVYFAGLGGEFTTIEIFTNQ